MKTNQINRRELTDNRESDWNTFKEILREAGGIEMFMLNDNPNIHFVTHYPDFEEGGYMLLYDAVIGGIGNLQKLSPF